VAGSGGGRKGEHRPDALAANGRRRVVMELKKRSRLPVYLDYEADVKPVLERMEKYRAEGVLVVKVRGCGVRVVPLSSRQRNGSRLLEETGSGGRLVLTREGFARSVPLEEYF